MNALSLANSPCVGECEISGKRVKKSQIRSLIKRFKNKFKR